MTFKQFISKIEFIKKNELPGLKAHRELSPIKIENLKAYEFPKNVKKAGVLVLLYPNKNKELQVLLTKRANYKGKHSKQISFPGGKAELSDKDIKETAFRETFEEVGLNPKNINFIRTLTNTYVPVSNFKVTPILAYTETTPIFKINREVNHTIELPIKILLDPKTKTFFKNNHNIKIPTFLYHQNYIWGATGVILNELKAIIKTL